MLRAAAQQRMGVCSVIMTFVCARCRYRVLCGFEPWADCPVCATVGVVFDKLPPYKPPDEPPPYTPQNIPHRVRVREPWKPAWKKPQVYWPMRDKRVAPTLTQPQWEYEGKGDPMLLDFECFNDSTYSPEYRTKLRDQVALEIFSMPDDEWNASPPFTKPGGQNKFWKNTRKG